MDGYAVCAVCPSQNGILELDKSGSGGGHLWREGFCLFDRLLDAVFDALFRELFDQRFDLLFDWL